jgi:hypothetical protein
MRPTTFVGAAGLALVLLVTTPSFAHAAKPGAGNKKGAAAGYDVSYPNCSSVLPSKPLFGVVGVDGGRPYATNGCLATEYSWAAASSGTAYPHVSFYANTADPGPVLSTHWPTGQTSPRACDGSWSEGCSYDYGWNAAADSFARAAAAAGTEQARAARWWLDVEQGNSWADASQTANWAAVNRADLQGAADYLLAQGVPQAGFYSTGYQWGQITGLNATTSGAYFPPTLPNWVAGATSLSGAQARCSSAYSFTGARVELTQYPSSGFDADYVC